MKLLTAIKKAAKKAEQCHGEVEYVVRRKYGLEKEIHRIGYYYISVYGENDIKLNRNRLVEKYRMKPNWYRWTKREKPKYMEE